MSKRTVVEFLANLIFKKTVQKQSGIMKINPVDKLIAEKQAKSVIDKLKSSKIDVNTLTQSDLKIMAEQIVNPSKHAEKAIPKELAKVLPFKYKRSFAEELADASKKGDFNRMQGIMKVDPKFKEVMKSFDEQKAAEALAKERAPKQTILEKIFYQTDEIPKDPIAKLKYSGLSEDQYKSVLKHGRTLDDVVYARDRSGMTIPQVMEAIEKKGPFPFASGGIAGMLGEPTYSDDNHRVPYDSGNMVLPKEKPKALNWLNTLDSKAAYNTLGPRTYFDMVAKFATEAKDKGDISNRQFMEIMQPFFGKGGETLTRKIDEEREYLDEYQTGGRVPFGGGGFNAARRLFLKTIGAGAAGVGAAKSGLFGLLKGSKSAVVKDLTSIPIEKVGAVICQTGSSLL